MSRLMSTLIWESFIELNSASLQEKFERNNFACNEAVAYSRLILEMLMSAPEIEVELIVSENLYKAFKTLLPEMEQLFEFTCNSTLFAGYKLNIGNYASNLAALAWLDLNFNMSDHGLIAWIAIDERILLLDYCRIFDKPWYDKIDYDHRYENHNYNSDALTTHTPSSDQVDTFASDEQQQIYPDFILTENSRGTDKLCLIGEDYKFDIHREKKGKKQWRCELKGCNARLHTNDCKILKKVGNHNLQQHQRSKTRAVNIAKTIKKNRTHNKTPNNKIAKLPNCLFHERNMLYFTDYVNNGGYWYDPKLYDPPYETANLTNNFRTG